MIRQRLQAAVITHWRGKITFGDETRFVGRVGDDWLRVKAMRTGWTTPWRPELYAEFKADGDGTRLTARIAANPLIKIFSGLLLGAPIAVFLLLAVSVVVALVRGGDVESGWLIGLFLIGFTGVCLTMNTLHIMMADGEAADLRSWLTTQLADPDPAVAG